MKAGYNIRILGNKCYRCGHEWKSQKQQERPKVCPKCKSPYWFKKKTKYSRTELEHIEEDNRTKP